MDIKSIVSEEVNREINRICALNEASAKLVHKKERKKTRDNEDFIKHVFHNAEKIHKIHHKDKEHSHHEDEDDDKDEKKSKKDKDKKSKKKKSKKKKSKSDAESNRIKNRDGNNIDVGDESQIRNNVTNDELINIAALARKVYPDHTPEGAQSQLRKKLKGLKNDNGSEYHLKSREASTIRKALNKI